MKNLILQQKLDAFENFKICKAYVKRQSGHTIKILRTNKGTEYTICGDFLKKKKWEHQLTIRNSAQHTTHIDIVHFGPKGPSQL